MLVALSPRRRVQLLRRGFRLSGRGYPAGMDTLVWLLIVVLIVALIVWVLRGGPRV